MVYLDYNATTPVDPRVLDIVCESMRSKSGNPSSQQHVSGQLAAESIGRARERVAVAIDATARDVVFTSGATEGISLGVIGAVLAQAPHRTNIVVSATEHKAVFAAAETGARLVGGEVRIVPVDAFGRLDVDHLSDLLDHSVGLVSVMAANNETGVVTSLRSISEMSRRAGAWLFSDATQILGKSRFSFSRSGADMTCLSSHKAYGPKGVGALIATREVRRKLVPISPGGGQEGGLRGGTENVAGIEGFGVAAKIARAELDHEISRCAELTRRLTLGLRRLAKPVEVLGADARLSNTVMLRFPGADADAVMARARGVAVSGGSACQSSVPSPSHVLLAMGLSRAAAEECLRVSVGRFTDSEQIDLAVESLAIAVSEVRKLT